MNNKNLAFYSMVFLALALMGLIIITQLFTNQSTQALRNGNIQAVETYKVNNRMQLLVNLSFDLQAKLSNPDTKIDDTRREKLSDSVTMLGYNTSILNSAISKLGYANNASKINSLVNDELNLFLYILVSTQSGNSIKRDSLANALNEARLSDKVYASCLEVQKLLENNLEQTLKKNTEQASVLSTYNRILAVVSILAILIMATIIIKRQSQQIKLIEELKIAEITALKSKNAKDDFVANMSHELRTPLNALIGFSNLLNQTALDTKQQEYVDVIRSGGYNLLNIVNDVLDLSKIEAGKLKIVNTPFNLMNVLRNIEKMFSASLAEKKLTYEWHVDEKIPTNLKGDAERLKQILINLIGNAIKFTNSGSIQLNTGIVWMDEEKGMYKLGFTIKDSGTGIPKEKIQTIFERFEQLEHVTTRQHGGTGLGLTIVKNLVEKMGGAISVYSEVGVGSEFNFTCIFEKASVNHSKNDDGNKVAQPSLSGYKILAAEDNKTNQTLLKHLLGKYGGQLTIAENGHEAIKLLNETHYDLVLMDIQMPLMDGYSAVKYIREHLHLDTIIIAMTAYVSEDEIDKCMNAGFNDYLAKPIEEKILVKTISKFIKKDFIVDDLPTGDGDFAFLKELVGDDMEAIDEIVKEMKNQWDIDKPELEQSVKDENVYEIKRILHRIKSTFSPLGPNHYMYVDITDVNGELISGENVINKTACQKLILRIDQFTEAL